MSETDRSILQTVLGSGSILLFGLGIQLLLNFGSRLAIARLLGRLEYGAISLGVTLLLTLSIVSLLGIDNGVGRYLPRYDTPAERGSLLRSGLELTLPVALVVSIGAASLSPTLARDVFHDPSVAPVLRVFSLCIPFLVVLKFAIGTIRGMKQTMPRIILENIGIPVSRFAFVVTALLAGLGVLGVSVAYVGAYVLVAVLAIVFMLRRTPIRKSEGDQMRRQLISFSAPLMVVATINMFFSNFDTLLIGYFSTTGKVGAYNVAYPLASLLTTALIAFGFVFMPVVSEQDANGGLGEVRDVYQTVSKWIFLLTLPVFLLFFSFPSRIIGLTFGPEYLDGGTALAALSVGFLVHAIGGPSGNVLTAIGRTRFIMTANLLVLLTNIVLNIILIPRYSLLGAAIATSVGYALMNGLYIAMLYRESRMQPFSRRFGRVFLVGGFIWLGFVALTYRLRPDTALFLLLYGAFLLIYAVVALFAGGVEQELLTLLDDVEARAGYDLTSLKRFLRYFSN